MKIKRLLGGILLLIYYFWVNTLRIFVDEEQGKENRVYLFWHRKMFPLFYTHRKRKISVLVSSHQDTLLVRKILKKMGFKIITGSSSKGGAKAAFEILKSFRKGWSIALTPDGPKGPRDRVKKSTLELLRVLDCSICLVGVGYRRKVIIPSWDRFEIPLPFTECYIILREIDPKRVEEIETGLKRVTEEAESKWRKK